jgi:CRISP-associated protein Cas1
VQPTDTLYGIVKNGVLTLSSGPGASLRVAQNHLLAKDGGTELKFRRAACPVSRVVVVRSEGFITIPAMRWLHEVGAALVVLQYDGTPIVTSMPRVITPAALRRTLALTSIETRLGKAIAGSLIKAKIAGQIATLRTFDRDAAADEIGTIMTQLHGASPLALLGVEGLASAVYFQALADWPLSFGKRQEVPDHWRTFGARTSSLTGAPRGAVLPAQAVLNYLYGVLASEITIALHAAGLDPALGILHADKDDRASLAYDLMEPARPVLDRWLLHWLQSATFSKRDFREDVWGYIRVTHPLNSHLAMTAALWRGIAEELVQWIYRRLSGENVALRLTGVNVLAAEATRRAVRWRLGNRLSRPVPATCAECSKALPKSRRKFCSGECSQAYHHDTHFQAIIAAAVTRRADPERARATNLATGRKSSRHAASRHAWRSRPEWSAADDERLRRWFADAVAPALRRCRLAAIMRATGVSKHFAVQLRSGRVAPHPRHVAALAEIAGLPYTGGSCELAYPYSVG